MSFKIKYFLIGMLITVSGCSRPAADPTQTTDTKSMTSTQYVSLTEPDGAVPVGEARQIASDGDVIALTGRIGGSAEPFVTDMAAFTIVDPKVPHCQPEEGCPTPWDYCCTQNEVKDNIATIKVVDEQGKPVGVDARTLLAVKELSLIVVSGKAKRDEQGNLTVLANTVFVKPVE